MKCRPLLSWVLTFVFIGSVFANGLPGDNTVDRPQHYIQCSDAQAIEVDFVFPGVSLEEVSAGSEHYSLLTIKGEGISGEIGAPQVPVITRLFAIQNDKRVIIKKIIPAYKTYSGVHPFPLQEEEYYDANSTADFICSDKYYKTGEFFPEEWITLSDPAVFRDYRIIPVNINPVRVNAAAGEAQVLTGLHLELAFDSGTAKNIKTRHFNKRVSSFERIYAQSIANYDWISPNGEDLKGSLLVIYPNVNGVSDILQPYIEWKQRLGYTVAAVSVPNGAATNIVQPIIQNAYNTFDPPLEAVVIVGDAAGSLDIDCYTYLNYSTDHTFALLEGNDILAEVIIGRISVDGLAQLATAINKILYYECNPTLTTTDWYKHGAVVAGSSSSGISTIQINHTIRSWWLESGFTQVDTMWYNMGASIPTFIINQCNSGISALNFRGYYGCNGFTVTNVMNLTNTGKLPLAAFLTSGTGSYGAASAAMNEAWLRAGSPTNPTGGIGGLGVSGETHTRYYNTFDLGLWFGLHTGEATTIGAMTFRGKLELFLTFQNDTVGMARQIYWTNLMGDPTTDLWNNVPLIIGVDHPDSIPAGTSAFTVTVRDDNGALLPGRYVTLWKGTETYVGGRTDDNGIFTASINTPTAGDMLVTVTYHNDYPYQGTVPVYVSEVNPSFNNLVIDDDNIAPSMGNGDGYANPGETLELDVQLKNFGNAAAAENITANLTSPDSSVNIVMSALNYPNLAPNAAVYGEGKFLVELDSYFNDGYIIPFTLTVNSAQGTFVSAFNLPVRSGQTEVTDAEFATGVLQPGETDDLTVTLRNIGQMSLTGVTAVLSSDDEQITIIDNQGTFGDIAAGQAVNNSGDTFSIQADALATEGHRVLLNMRLTSAEGCEQDLLFEIILGQISADDPIGPDDYGYYCVDNADVEYSGHPVFDWVEIRNIGTPINLPDFGNSQDVSTYVHLPFDFTFYGVTSDTLTVCSNGWLALGNQAYFSDFRNYPMPSAAGANAGMICPLWDDLVRGNGDVYYWNDTANHRFIIEYCNVAYMYGAGILKFEIILYDPAFYPTPTGDGEMVFQYHTFQINQGPSSDNLYWTTGIENHNHTIGLQYAYWNVYTPGASIIASGRAVKFTTNEPLRTPQPETVEITLEPINPPIQIPAVGGAFQYGLLLYNSGTQTTVFDTWIMLTLPDSSMVGPLLLRQNLSLAQGDSLQRTMTQNVPGAALPGEYIYTAKTGDYSLNAIWDSSYFNFTKLGADASSGGEWQLIGWDNITASSAAIPLKYELNDAHPNPFNPLTDINFTLPKSGRVTLTVFNTLGQKVAALKDSWCEAGGHSITFDGRQLASGIYFYNLKADDFSQTKKMLLMK